MVQNGKPLGQMTIKLGLDSTAFSSSLTGAARAVKTATKEMTANFKILDSGGKKIDTLKNKQQDLTKVINAQKNELKYLQEAYEKTLDSEGKATSTTARAAQKYNEASAKLAGYESQLKSVSIELRELTSKTIENGHAIESFGKSLQGLGSSFTSLGKKMTIALTAPLAAFTGSLIKNGVEVRKFRAQAQLFYENLYQDTERAKNQLDDLMTFAKKTPYAYESIVEADMIMQTFGMSTERSHVTLEALANTLAATGGSSADLSSLATVMGQIESSGKLSLQDMNQLVNAKIPALKIVGNQLSMTVMDLRTAISKGEVSSEQAISALNEGLMAGTNGLNGATVSYMGALDKVKRQLPGALDSFKSARKSLALDLISSDVYDGMINAVNKATEMIKTGAMEPVIKAISNTIGELIQKVIELADWFIKLSPSTQQFITKLIFMGGVLGPILLLVGNLTSKFGFLFSVIGKGMVNFGTYRAQFDTFGKFISGSLSVGFKSLLGPIGLVSAGILILAGAFKFMQSQNISVADVLNSFLGIIKNIIGVFDHLFQRLTNLTIVKTLIDIVASAFSKLNSVVPQSQGVFDNLNKVIDSFFNLIEVLSPVLIGLLAGFIAFKAVTGVITLFSGLSSVVTGLSGALMVLKGGLAGVFKTLTGFIIANPIGLIVAAIATLVAGFVYLYKTNDTFKVSVDRLVSTLKDKFGVALDVTSEKLRLLGQWFSRVFEVIGSCMKDFVAKTIEAGSVFKEKFGDKIHVALEFIGTAFSKGLELLDQWGGKFGAIGAVVGFVISQLVKVGLSLVGISGPLGFIISAIAAVATALIKTGNVSVDGLTTVFDGWAESIQNISRYLTTALPSIVESITGIITGLVSKVTEFIPIIVEAITGILDTIVGALITILPEIINVGVTIILKIVEGITTYLPKIIDVTLNIVTTILSGIAYYLPKLLTIGIQILTKIINGITKALPKIVEVLSLVVNTIVKIIVELLPKLLEIGIQIIMSIIEGILSMLPIILETAVTLFITLVTGIIGMLPLLIDAGIQIIVALLGALIGALPKIIEAGIQLVLALIQGIIQILPKLLESILIIIGALLLTIVQNLPKIIAAGIQILLALISGIMKILPQLITTAIKLLVTMLATILGYLPQLLTAGAKLIMSLITGALSLLQEIIKAGGTLLTALMTKVFSFFEPLKTAGSDLVKKLVDGLVGGVEAVKKAATKIGNALMGPIEKGVNGVINGINWVLEKVGAGDSKLKEWKFAGFEKGSSGLSRDTMGIVNDQKGSTYKEFVKPPNGPGFIPEGRNVLLPMAKGTQIIPAQATKEMMADNRIPKFKNGLWDGIKDGAGKVGNKIKEVALDVWDFVENPGSLLEKAVGTFTDFKDVFNPYMSIATGAVKTMVKGSTSFIKKFMDDMMSSGDFDGSIGDMGVFSYLSDIANKVIQKFPGMRMTSGMREGDPYYHGKRQAIDIAFPASMNGSQKNKEAANYAFEKFASKVGYVITNGKVRDRSGMSGQGKSGQWVNWPDNDHYDHVHINGLLGAADVGKGGGSSPNGFGVERWRSQVAKASSMMKQHATSGEINGILAQIQRESGGNEGITQSSAVWDINMASGNPAKGLLQYIPSTFNAFKVGGYGNIMKGYHQLLAFFNNSNWRRDLPYGNSGWGPTGHRLRGFENGGLVLQHQVAQIAEGNKPEMVIPLTKKTRAIQLINKARQIIGIDEKNAVVVNNDQSDVINELSLTNNKMDKVIDLLIGLVGTLGSIDIDRNSLIKFVNEQQGRSFNQMNFTKKV